MCTIVFDLASMLQSSLLVGVILRHELCRSWYEHTRARVGARRHPCCSGVVAGARACGYVIMCVFFTSGVRADSFHLIKRNTTCSVVTKLRQRCYRCWIRQAQHTHASNPDELQEEKKNTEKNRRQKNAATRLSYDIYIPGTVYIYLDAYVR